MGFTGVLIDEAHGGVDMGFMTAGLIAQEMGRNLSASPFLSTAILAATALRHSGSEAQKHRLLPAIAAGEAVLSVAIDEHVKHNPTHVTTTAERSGNGFKLNGHKLMVPDAHMADAHIVLARTSGDEQDKEGLSFFLVEKDTAGLETERTIMVDSRNAGRLKMNDVEVTADAVLGEVDDAAGTLRKVLLAGRAALVAEMQGATEALFDATNDYLKQRKQFGKLIGEYQALQHRAAHLYSEVELGKTAMLAALTALENDDPFADNIVAMAKAKMGDVAKLAGQESIQMHGGIGMTDELDLGLYFKRIRVAQEMFGDAHFHAEQIAQISGY